ncbi:DUF6171 family protein [Ruminiclostridium cellulolyticum]|uniref:Uncharacterized protein n=1 Tax=Ruminiclostridium cellulolyticum (strain ATCC 35319 / DSM 5812 / JCM 6584 / H10) TaxID=394503 RepID=B8I0N7_RUMCH|nr:DUF6171 family protein [Ruminiclostridium cellulolyticum]ACL75612.1 hypothetical protein Ccel_1256 [Ruminiclostridium cellulolyticum H10]
MKDNCLKCHRNIHITHNDIEMEVKRVVKSGVPLARNEQYEKRLEVCNSCKHLADGITCMICGCIVKARAMNALRICPHPSGNKW